MDKQTTIGFILIGLILLVWMWISAPPPRSPQVPQADTTFAYGQRIEDSPRQVENKVDVGRSMQDSLGIYFAHLASGTEKILVVETELYRAEISTKGGVIRQWELKKFDTWDKHPVQLIDFDKGGDFSILFTSADGKLINTKGLFFDANYYDRERITLRGKDEYSVELTLKINETSYIVKSFRFVNGKYSLDATVRFENMQGIVSNFEYQIVWETGLRLTEKNSLDEAEYSAAYSQIGGELVELNAADFDREQRVSPSGSTQWVAARTKYFAVALIASDKKANGAYLAGTRHRLPDKGVKENYSIGLKEPFRGLSREIASCTLFLGPLEYYVVKGYGVDLERIMSFGWEWIIRPISIYAILPLFKFLHSFIPNYGFVIIVFTFIIRLLFYPLTQVSMKSMKKMQALQPMMTELKEKYKDDPQRMNKEVMKLYKEYGVNPASGCLPLLPQLPILYALWTVFRGAIELRQASFLFWIKDLSTPDTIVHLPFTIPLVGISQVSGLAVFMGLTMFIQQKMTVKDPRQKMMVWFLPVLMMLLFNSFPSGLNLYYSFFNLLAIAQQLWIMKQGGAQVELRKVDAAKRKKSRGLFSRVELPKLKR